MSDGRASIETLSSANAGCIQGQHVSEELSPQEAAGNIVALQAGRSATPGQAFTRLYNTVYSDLQH